MTSDLRAMIVELNVPLLENKIKQIFRQMVKAIDYCHS